MAAAVSKSDAWLSPLPSISREQVHARQIRTILLMATAAWVIIVGFVWTIGRVGGVW